MGPTNIALVKLFRANEAFRGAQARLDAAARNVRIQERRVADLAEKLKLAQAHLMEQQAQAGQLDLDLRSRDVHIERLRTQQQTAKNNKEYQAFLVEINTGKVDRNKVEDEAMKVLEIVEREQNEVGAMQTQLEAERKKLETLQAQSGDTVKRLTAEVEALRPARDAAAAAVTPKGRDAFDKLAERYEGEALSALGKPDRRREEYICGACNMSLVADVYNKLHSRDELVVCPSCRRILYIPEDLPPETAINSAKTTSAAKRSAKSKDAASAAGMPEPVIEQRAKGRWGELLNGAQGESVKAAVDAGNDPVSLRVNINGELAGYYKGKSREHLERVIRYRMQEARVDGVADVLEEPVPSSETQAAENQSGEQQSGGQQSGEHQVAQAQDGVSVPQA
ncbi:MAG TPA: C4-type zinc ribbon domain-containing protein [Tepidisphaeraceae bacterium]|jgi:predicted  nucleic acid-binding Zn-ribbon protein